MSAEASARAEDQHTLAMYAAEGADMPQSWPTALDLSLQAAEAGHGLAQAELAAMPKLEVILALGKGAHDQILRALTVRPAGDYPFIHNRLHKLPTGLHLADSYHCSRYNTNTGVLTPEMFRRVFAAVRKHLDTK